MSRAVATRIGVVAGALGSDPREIARISRVIGFNGVLFDVWTSSMSLADLSMTGRREFKHILSGQNQELIGLQMDFGPKGLGIGADVDRELSRMEKAMETAAGLQSPLLCIDLGPLPRPAIIDRPKLKVTPQEAGLIIIPQTTESPSLRPPPTTPPDPAFVSQIASALVEAGVRADRYGVMVAFATSLASFASLGQSLAAARCPWFGYDLDPVAILRDDWSDDEVFSAAGSAIHHARARDALIGDDNRTRPTVIGCGNAKWEGFLSRLDEAGYQGYVTIDPVELSDRKAAATEGLKHLQSFQAQP